MFINIKELVEQAETFGSVCEVAILNEVETTGRTRAEIVSMMDINLMTMSNSIIKGREGRKSLSGLTGGDAKKLDVYLASGKSISGHATLSAVRNAIAVNEVNAQMGLICATPTAGSAGTLPGVLFEATEKLNLSHEQQLEFLFTAAAFGMAIANNSTISGAEGGCQAEVGSASAMAAAALTVVAGGSAQQAAHAISLTLQNFLGLICDPVAGLVEVPCVNRNALGASQAMVSADMALAGIESIFSADEVVAVMYQVGKSLPAAHRETAEGGLAQTPTGRAIMERLFGQNK
ncbi:L-serine ammonia-lyase, iron-sulfur-dependent, subunit alpha [Lactovum miscens]|uniref:L-serine dehydratase n=1 Tax=Lactovum miscens TaxID=190387 RepID=A0A841C773_9LACT|nr:L-serine ammonia-lyase, iron-sulfur-dependent, subunit alpha [Lactovum miscens]MBB5887442.1 L-serine dehydratase [Lactovum miscens]